MSENNQLAGLSLIKCEMVGNSIMLLRVEDRQNKNTFSQALTNEIDICLQIINRSENLKAVVITGYDSYFLSGGSKQELFELHKGAMQFTDINTYRFGIDCNVPVIAAMQGHAIGGGFVMGLFCDLAVISRESIYTFNFMKYGFTPGMGATYIASEKLGAALSCEMLLTARRYRGEMLKTKGVAFDVLPRAEVLGASLDIAEALAEMPRKSLVHLKKHMNIRLNRELGECIERELALHELTIHEPEVRSRITKLF
ncbi:MAG: polyketide synthase [Candidatus Thiodiazotropha sp.]